MKQRTKELIRWAEEHFRLYQISILTNPKKHGLTDNGADMEFNYSTDFLHFLKTLPDIENKLCFGGYIQDVNGIPCCHGDKIKVPYHLNGECEEGTLYWSSKDFRFCFKKGNRLFVLAKEFIKE